ncbi:hypothetical protein LINGRAPRIM_LOCUS1259 [Linum grandiflorum]
MNTHCQANHVLGFLSFQWYSEMEVGVAGKNLKLEIKKMWRTESGKVTHIGVEWDRSSSILCVII